jgi:sugar O-acyltransferase (sialic acid O-acetyltransferase NeuD family)
MSTSTETNVPEVIILGASGHGKVVLCTLRSAGFRVYGFLDDNFTLFQSKFSGHLVHGPLNNVLDFDQPVGVIAIGENTTRKKIATFYPSVAWVSPVHRSAHVEQTVYIGQGTVIFAGAVVQMDARIGDHCIINTGATVDHDCQIGDFVHVGPGVNISGNVSIGELSWIGIGSQVIQGISIGSNTIIGAGSTVLHNIPDNVIAYGTPARMIRKREG